MEIQEYCVRVQLDVSKPLIRMFCLVFPDAEEPIGGFLLHVRSNGSCGVQLKCAGSVGIGNEPFLVERLAALIRDGEYDVPADDPDRLPLSVNQRRLPQPDMQPVILPADDLVAAPLLPGMKCKTSSLFI